MMRLYMDLLGDFLPCSAFVRFLLAPSGRVASAGRQRRTDAPAFQRRLALLSVRPLRRHLLARRPTAAATPRAYRRSAPSRTQAPR